MSLFKALVGLVGEDAADELIDMATQRPPIHDRIRQCLSESLDDPEAFMAAWRSSSQVLPSLVNTEGESRREAAKARYMSELHPRLREVVLEEADHLCHYCGDRAIGVDHVIPRKQGGGNERSNLVAACRQCNSRKSARTPDEWKGALLKEVRCATERAQAAERVLAHMARR